MWILLKLICVIIHSSVVILLPEWRYFKAIGMHFPQWSTRGSFCRWEWACEAKLKGDCCRGGRLSSFNPPLGLRLRRGEMTLPPVYTTSPEAPSVWRKLPVCRPRTKNSTYSAKLFLWSEQAGLQTAGSVANGKRGNKASWCVSQAGCDGIIILFPSCFWSATPSIVTVLNTMVY